MRLIMGDVTMEPGALLSSTKSFVYLAEAVIQPLILLFGLATNIASIVVLRKVRMNEVFRICLMSLSVVDTLACLIGFVQLMVEVGYFNGDIIQGYMDPKAMASNALYFAYLMFMCSSASIVILIAVIRNIFVITPMKARAYFTPHKTVLLSFMAFFVTFLLFLPVSLKVITQSCKYEVNNSVCDWMNSTTPNLHDFGRIYLHYFLSALFGPVLIVIYIICVISIRFTVRKSIKTLTVITPRTSKALLPGNNAHTTAVTNDARMRSRTAARITKTLMIILILDVVCTLPYVIQGIGLLVAAGQSIFDENGDAGKIYDAIVEIFLNLRPSYNFWLYVYQHPEFRIRLKLLMSQVCMPCYRASCCPCKLDPAAMTPLKTPVHWSNSTPSPDKKGPWFRRISSRLQEIGTSLVAGQQNEGSAASMDSESEAVTASN